MDAAPTERSCRNSRRRASLIPHGSLPQARHPCGPTRIHPARVATLTDKAPAGDDWIHEIKLDGYRTSACLETGKVRMLTRSDLDWTMRFRRSRRSGPCPEEFQRTVDGCWNSPIRDNLVDCDRRADDKRR